MDKIAAYIQNFNNSAGRHIVSIEISAGIVISAVVLKKTLNISIGIETEPAEAAKAAIFLSIGLIATQKLLYIALDL